MDDVDDNDDDDDDDDESSSSDELQQLFRDGTQSSGSLGAIEAPAHFSHACNILWAVHHWQSLCHHQLAEFQGPALLLSKAHLLHRPHGPRQLLHVSLGGHTARW